MAQAALESVLKEIKTLEAEELQEVARTVRQLLSSSEKDSEREDILRVLQASGLVKEIKRPSMGINHAHPLIPIQGAPLSETIIEERG